SVPDLHCDDAAGDDRLDIDLGLGLDDPDLADAHLKVLGLHLAEAEGKLFSRIGAVLASRSEDVAPSCQDHEHRRDKRPLHFLGHASPSNPITHEGAGRVPERRRASQEMKAPGESFWMPWMAASAFSGGSSCRCGASRTATRLRAR